MAKKTPWKSSTNIKAFIEGQNVEVHLKGVRLSYAHLFEPQENKNQKTGEIEGYSYSLNALVPKATEDDVLLLQAVQKKVIELKWGEEKSKQPRIPSDRRAVRDGEPKDEDTGERVPLYDGYEGMIYVSCNRRIKVDEKDGPNPVQLLDSRKGSDGKFPRLKKNSGKLYSGCIADVIARFYGYDGTKHGNPDRVNASLEAVKFVRHAPAFGAKPVDADSAFDEEEDDEMEGTTGSDFSSEDDDDLLG